MKYWMLGGLMLMNTAVWAQQGPAGGYPPPPPGAYQSAPVTPQNSFPKFTVQVISATPIYRTQMQERRVCDEPAPTSGNSTAGTIIGGLAGGLLGHQVGKGKGNTLATVAGAVGGAMAGNAIGGNVQAQPECRMVAEQHQFVAGYDVVYDFSGQRGRVTLPNQPGPTLVVEVRPSGL